MEVDAFSKFSPLEEPAMSTNTKLLLSAEITLALVAGFVAFVCPVWVWVSILGCAIVIAPDMRTEWE